MIKQLNMLLPIFIISILACRKDMPDMWKTVQSRTANTDLMQDSLSNQIRNDSLLTLIEKMQHNATDSKKTENRNLLLLQAFDTVSGCFLTVGKGVRNPDFPAEAQNASRRTAAKISGGHWALALKSWSSENSQINSDQISGEILYSRIIYEKCIGDTLYVLMEVPIGSICIK